MPVQLRVPIKSIPRAKVSAIKIEIMPEQGRAWVDVWVTPGRGAEGEDFEAVSRDPDTGTDAWHYRLRDGRMPICPPDNAVFSDEGIQGDLGQCDTCGSWVNVSAGPCPEAGCDGEIEPYDGFSRLCGAISADGASLYDVIKDGVYDFLIDRGHQVPDPNTWDLRPILDATREV